MRLSKASEQRPNRYFVPKALKNICNPPLADQILSYHCSPNKSPDGGTGRRARLKIWLSQGSAGSIPVLGTKITKQLHPV